MKITIRSKATGDWVKLIYDPYFKISDIEKFFGDEDNNPVKQLITLSFRDVIYCKEKLVKNDTGRLKEVSTINLNLALTRLQELTNRKGDTFDQRWKTFLIDL